MATITGRVFIVNGRTYEMRAWTGGDKPPDYLTSPDYMAIRGRLYREQWADYVAYWYDAPGPDVRRTFWGLATADAWRTVTDGRM